VLHLAIVVVLIWLSINIAFVVLRLRATRSPYDVRDLPRSIAYHPEVVSLHRQIRR
jgi:hypothetical protein